MDKKRPKTAGVEDADTGYKMTVGEPGDPEECSHYERLDIKNTAKILDLGMDINLHGRYRLDLYSNSIYQKYTFLTEACRKNYPYMVKFLLNRGADVDQESDEGMTPLIMASLSPSRIKIIRLLLAAGADVNKVDAVGNTALSHACENGCVESARLLLDAGADTDTQDIYGQTPLYYACSRGHTETARIIINAGADPDAVCVGGNTALIIACIKRHTDTAEMLIANNADLNLGNTEGKTALHVTCADHRKSGRLVKSLIAAGADINLRDIEGWTPLHCAALFPRTGVMKILIMAGADLYAAAPDKGTPLDIIRSRSGEKYAKYSEELKELFRRVSGQRLKKEDMRKTDPTGFEFYI